MSRQIAILIASIFITFNEVNPLFRTDNKSSPIYRTSPDNDGLYSQTSPTQLTHATKKTKTIYNNSPQHPSRVSLYNYRLSLSYTAPYLTSSASFSKSCARFSHHFPRTGDFRGFSFKIAVVDVVFSVVHFLHTSFGYEYIVTVFGWCRRLCAITSSMGRPHQTPGIYFCHLSDPSLWFLFRLFIIYGNSANISRHNHHYFEKSNLIKSGEKMKITHVTQYVLRCFPL